MLGRLRALLILGGIMLLTSFVDYLMQYPDSFIAQILPNSVMRLSWEHYLGLSLTFIASLFAWLSAVAVGYFLGMLSASAVVDRRTPAIIRRIGQGIDRFYEVMWVIPFVLTINLALAIGMRMHVNDGFPQPLVGLLLIAICGVVLGGFSVYRAIFRAVSSSKDEDRFLVLSLYHAHNGGTGLTSAWNDFRASWTYAGRLRDCAIGQFRESLIHAFFLSLVAIMILEMVTPSFYEWFYPQSGATADWLGGAGRQILQAQQTYAFDRIAGVIWIVILFCWTISYLVNKATHHYWMRYYGESE